ncbi:MAG: zinc ribbon domain-containing protein [Aureliella sp.]|jgi:predicted  nucleic acid-binding Zn-ribbon protein
MSISASVLQTLHRIHRQKADLTGQLERGPKQIQAAKAKIEMAKKALDEIREKQKNLRMEADRRQLQLREREARISTLEGRMNAAKENREYQTLKEQIAADRQANNVLSDEILELLEQVDVVHAQIDPANERIKLAEAEAAEIEKRVRDRMQVVDTDLKRVTAELAQVETQLHGDFKRDYDRLVSLKGEDSIAETEGNCCGGCYQMLTPTLLDRLSSQQSVVCPTCGRLLYQA